ncbi:MAG: polysaccharide deacetylase family protein [Oscillospiraceae bacterium]|nr:polysaccharide deacetylase family protein [Oscillospiraceae bacterium]
MKKFKLLSILLFVILFQFIFYPNEAALVIATELQVVDENKYIALTFDDGPCSSLTPQLIDALKTYNAKATFFLLGNMVKSNPDIVKMIYSNGNEIGSHTYSHPNLIYLSDNRINSELQSTAELIMSITGSYPTLFRPPYGEHNQNIDNIAMAYNTPIILWNVDTLDWLYKDANHVYNHISSNLNDGNVILLHDIHPTSVEAALRILQDYSEKGYKFVTVSELFKIKNIVLSSGVSYCGIP